jgi:hypothetical protein
MKRVTHDEIVAGSIDLATAVIASFTEADRAYIVETIQVEMERATIRDLLSALYVLRALAIKRTAN